MPMAIGAFKHAGWGDYAVSGARLLLTINGHRVPDAVTIKSWSD